MSMVAAAGAENLKTVDGALILYVGSAVPRDGGGIIDTLDEVISREVIGQETVRLSVSGEQSLVKFHEAYSEFSCIASWQANLESEDSFLFEWVKRLLPAPSFFRQLGGYGSEGEELSACPADPATDPFLRADAQTAHLSFVIFDTRAPDWKNVELALHDALGRIVPRSGKPYAISALICPRILQFRTPVRAAVRMRPHTAEITRLIKEVVAGKTALREGLRLHLEDVVPGLPTVSFPNGTRDFDAEEQPEINIFDVYFDRVSDFEGRVHGSGRPEREAEECVDLGNGEWPASVNVALTLDASLRFVWTQVAASTIPSAVDNTQVRRMLDALAGRKIRTKPARPPGPHAEVIDHGTQPMPDAHVAPLILAAIDAAARETRETGNTPTPDGEAVAPDLLAIGAGAPPAGTEPAPDLDATPPHAPVSDPAMPKIGTERLPDTEATATNVAAMGTAAPESETEPALDRGGIRPTPPAPGDIATGTGAVPFESWFVIEAYEDLNRWWHRRAVRIDSTPVAVSRAEAGARRAWRGRKGIGDRIRPGRGLRRVCRYTDYRGRRRRRVLCGAGMVGEGAKRRQPDVLPHDPPGSHRASTGRRPPAIAQTPH